MAYTVEPSAVTDISTIDLSVSNKDLKHYKVKYNEKFAISTQVSKIIVFDPRRSKSLQINAKGNTYSIDVTGHAGSGISDILDADVPWVSLKSAITADFYSGGNDLNADILAVRITSGVPGAEVATTVADFEVNATQHEPNPDGK